MDTTQKNRQFMQCPIMTGIMSESDQSKGITHPIHSKEVTGKLVELPFEDAITNPKYADLLESRRSQRMFTDEPMTGSQLAFMLWSSQGMQRFREGSQVAVLRPVPSGGCRHPFEMYVMVKNVAGLQPGFYRYAPMVNIGEKRVSIEFLAALDENYDEHITALLAKQRWAAKAPVVLFISCVPYRSEWRYGESAHRPMLIDLGHIGQNIMLSAEALGLGSCCLAAFDQKLCDDTFGFNGTDEYTVYAVPVGNIKR